MTGKNKNIRTDQSRFLRYRKGEMTGRERNEFEHDLQKDPFAEEAAEGFESLTPGEMQDDMASLTGKIHARAGRRKNYVLYRIAASVAVLMIVSSVFIVLDRKNRNTPVSLAEQEQVPFTIARSEPIKSESEEKPGRAAERQREEKKSLKAADEQPEEHISEPPQNIEKVQQPSPDLKAAGEPALPERRAMAEEVQAKMPAGAASERSLKKAEPAPKITGHVISSADTMQTDVGALDEVVVVGYGVSKSDKNDVTDSYKPPEPVNGKAAFNSYLEANIHHPDSTTGQRAVVVAKFPVLEDGTTGNIRIVRTPGERFSKEAIRLIKSGPEWKPAMRHGVAVEDSVTLRIVFK